MFDYQKAVNMLDLQSDDIIYDIACGTGKNIPHILEKLEADHIYGFDYSHALLNQARKKFPNAHFYHTDVTKVFNHKTPPPSKIICSYSLSMIDKRENALDVMWNMLEKNGTLVVLDFNPKRTPRRRWKLLQKFLTLCQINLQQDVAKYLQNKTKKIEVLTLNKWYNIIIKATK